jgi:hypothetical protein
MADISKTCILIVGLPRSGTSSIAQFFDHLGSYFGDPSRFLDTTKLKHNPIFYELQWINDFNDRMLGVWGCTYDQDVMPVEKDFDRPEIKSLRVELKNKLMQEFGDRPMIGIKDPRICFTFPLWRDVLTELGYAIRTVLALRAASAIIKSNRALMPGRLSRWQRFYARHLLAVRYFTRDIPVCHFDYDVLMRDPVNYGRQKAEELGLPISNPAEATHHLSGQHYHHQPDDAGTGDPWVDRIDADLRAGRLDPNEYIEFRSIASLFIEDLHEQDLEIQKALSKKDGYIQSVEAFNKDAANAIAHKDQQIADLTAMIDKSAEQLQATKEVVASRDAQIQRIQEELAQLHADLKQNREDLAHRQSRMESLAVELGGMTAKRAEAEGRCAVLTQELAALTQELNDLQARRMVRLMHLFDRAGKRDSKPSPP